MHFYQSVGVPLIHHPAAVTEMNDHRIDMTTDISHPLELEFECLNCHQTLRKSVTVNPKTVKCRNCKGSRMVWHKVRVDSPAPDDSAASGQLFV
jgi:DNA-directed RNA polymerase subunit RPC12/RpoP